MGCNGVMCLFELDCSCDGTHIIILYRTALYLLYSLMSCYCSVVLIGYPPKGLSLRNTGASLTELGIKSGDSLIVEEQSPQAVTEARHLSPPHKEEAPIPKITRRFVYV